MREKMGGDELDILFHEDLIDHVLHATYLRSKLLRVVI